MEVIRARIPGLILIKPRLFHDSRGYFLETFHLERYRLEGGMPHKFVQDNLSYSTRGVIRGLHYQLGHPQGKLVMVLKGEIFDVAVDIRKGSPSFSKWEGFKLSSDDHCQLFIPPGFAHGFCVLSDEALVLYKCTDFYAPAEERGLRWDDPSIGIDWPVGEPNVSEKDASYPILRSIPRSDLPSYSGLDAEAEIGS